MEQPPQNEATNISLGSTALTVSYTPREMRMFTISETELDALAEGATPVSLAFLGMAFGAFVAFAITLATVQLTELRQYVLFVALTVIFGVLALFFSALFVREYMANSRRLARLKEAKKEVV